jgi:hypothetical protein
MTTNGAQFEHYKNARAIARRLALDYARVRYTLHFYIEDEQHASVKTGTRFVEVSACIPLLATTNVKIPMPVGLPTRVAWRGGSKERMVCRLTIALVGTGSDGQDESDVGEHGYESTEVHWAQRQTRTADEGARIHGTFVVPDLTPQLDVGAIEPSHWTIDARLSTSRDLQIDQIEFTHDSDEHPALIDLLTEEATEGNMATAMRLLRDAKPELDRSCFVGGGVVPDFGWSRENGHESESSGESSHKRKLND